MTHQLKNLKTKPGPNWSWFADRSLSTATSRKAVLLSHWKFAFPWFLCLLAGSPGNICYISYVCIHIYIYIYIYIFTYVPCEYVFLCNAIAAIRCIGVMLFMFITHQLSIIVSAWPQYSDFFTNTHMKAFLLSLVCQFQKNAEATNRNRSCTVLQTLWRPLYTYIYILYVHWYT